MRFGAGDPKPPWSHQPLTAEEFDRLDSLLQRQLDAGGLGIGVTIAESPAASRAEIFRVFQIAARNRVPVYAHLRSGDGLEGPGLAAVQEVLADAAATGAALHYVHLNGPCRTAPHAVLELIESARRRGLDVTGEVYPYTAASTFIQTAIFDPGWQERLGISYGDLEWPATGERLTQGSFDRYRAQGGWVILHALPQSVVDLLVARPGIMIASDAVPYVEGRGHPRGSGTFARVLGRYVREQRSLTLIEAVRKMTLLPAERVRGAVPRMARKGRLQIGADADITVFDPATVIDRATFQSPEQPSAGIPYVVVNGTVVVKSGELVAGAAPGRAIRRTPVR